MVARLSTVAATVFPDARRPPSDAAASPSAAAAATRASLSDVIDCANVCQSLNKPSEQQRWQRAQNDASFHTRARGSALAFCPHARAPASTVRRSQVFARPPSRLTPASLFVDRRAEPFIPSGDCAHASGPANRWKSQTHTIKAAEEKNETPDYHAS